MRNSLNESTPTNDRQRGLRVLHYMGTNFGMTGVETFILQLCGAQKRLGLDPCITLDVEGRSEVVVKAAAMGVTVHDFPKRGRYGDAIHRKLGSAALRARQINELLDHLDDTDVLHIHSVGLSGLDALIASVLKRVRPVVVTHHTTIGWANSAESRKGAATCFLEKKIATHVVMPYKAAANELGQFGFPDQLVHVIPFCVDELMFGAPATPTSEQFVIIMAARLIAGKGHIELLQAVGRLVVNFPQLRVRFIGDGPARAEIEAEIDRLDLRRVVEIKGHVPHDTMPNELRFGSLIVLPSYMSGETFPLSLLEGMAMGLPAIGSRWFGIPDIVADGVTGIVVEPRDSEGLELAIRRFLSEPQFLREAGIRARERVAAEFTAAAVARRYEQLYLSP